MSLLAHLNLPNTFLGPLLLVACVLCLVTVLPEMDFGKVKIPSVPKRDRLRAVAVSFSIFAVIGLVSYRFGEKASPMGDTPGSTKSSYDLSSPTSEVILTLEDAKTTITILDFEGERGNLDDAAKERMAITVRRYPELTESQLPLLAFADLVFENGDYLSASNVYRKALDELPSFARAYDAIQGMATAGFYGSGQHRLGLRFLCEQYSLSPDKTHRFRHQMHAHIRKIAVDEGYAAAEEAIQTLRQKFSCDAEDLSEAWIPIPLLFMENLFRGRYVPPHSIRREDRAYIGRILGRDVYFKDYLLLYASRSRYVKDSSVGNLDTILEDFPDSYVRDVSLFARVLSDDGPAAATYASKYLLEYPEGSKTVDVFVAGLNSLLESGSDLGAFNSVLISEFSAPARKFIQQHGDVFSRDDVQYALLRSVPKPFALGLARNYIDSWSAGTHIDLAREILVGGILEITDIENLSEVRSRVPEIPHRGRDLDLDLVVSAFRNDCQRNVEDLANLSFRALSRRLTQYHGVFEEKHGTGIYRQSVDLDLPERSSIPCFPNFGNSEHVIDGKDLAATVEFLGDLADAMDALDDDALGRLAITLHQCHIARLRVIARKRGGVCAAMSRIFPTNASFGAAASGVSDVIYRSDPSENSEFLFLSAMSNRRQGNFVAYVNKLHEFTISHRESSLIDDVYAELGWYYLQTKEFDRANFFLTEAVENFLGMNAYDNALHWLVKLERKRGHFFRAFELQQELAGYVASERLLKGGERQKEELREAVYVGEELETWPNRR